MQIKNLFENIRKVVSVIKHDGVNAFLRLLYYKLAFAKDKMYAKTIQRWFPNLQKGSCLTQQKLVIFTGIPFDDIGGGQRSAQLTHAAIKTGMSVLYIYAYPKYDVAKRRFVISKVSIANLSHKYVKQLTTSDFLKFVHGDCTVVFEIPHPLFMEYFEITKKRGIRTVFELIDDWSTNLGGEWYDQAVFEKFVLKADIVTGTAKVLVNKLIDEGRKDVFYLPNAANENIFNREKKYPRPSDLPANPVALYIGSLYGDWFGWDYVIKAAENNPHINFCLIGNKPASISMPFSHNVHFLGEKKIIQLPAYLTAADFCLLPFIPGPLADSVSPIKVFEYLFMGKPVVSSNFAEISDFPYLNIGKNEDEFSTLCQNIYQEGDQKNISQCLLDEFIYRNSWFLRLQKLIDLEGLQNVSVIILIHNNRNIIGRCLQSLLENCSSYLHEIIVVDNLSEDSGAEYVIENFPQVRLIKNNVNGCSSGRNLGVKNSSAKYLAFFDSDQWFTSAFGFEEALNILASHGEIGAVGWSAGWLNLNKGKLSDSIADYHVNRAMNTRASLNGYRTDISYLASSGLFIPRTVFEATGGFDEAYDPFEFEDTDLSFAIKKLGFLIAYRDLSSIQHKAHQTTKASENSPEFLELYSRNSKYFIEKWRDYGRFFVKYKP